MTIPLLLLAVCAILVGFLGTPYWPWLQRTLDPTSAHGAANTGLGLMLASIAFVAFGLGIGAALYLRRLRATPTAPDPLAARAPALFSALTQRLGFDTLYAATFGRLNHALASAADAFDRYVLDGAVRFLARLGEFTGLVNRDTDEHLLNGGFDAASGTLRETGIAYSHSQTGQPHGYLRTVALGFAVIALVVLLGGVR